MREPALNEKRLLIGYVYHCPISAAVLKQHRKNTDYIKNEGFRIRLGLKVPGQPSCLAAVLHRLIFNVFLIINLI